MVKIRYAWMAIAAVAAGIAGSAYAGGDNDMNPMYGDSWAALEGDGHSAGARVPAPTGAFVAHEMDGHTQPLPFADSIARMQARMHDAAQHMSDSTWHGQAAPAATPRQADVHQVDPFEDKAGG